MGHNNITACTKTIVLLVSTIISLMCLAIMGFSTQCWHFYEKQLPEYNEMIASMATSVTSKTLIVLLIRTIISLHVQKL